MINPPFSQSQLATLERMEIGLDRICEAVERLNDIGRTVGMPFIALRYWDGKKWQTEHHFYSLLFDLRSENTLIQLAVIEKIIASRQQTDQQTKEIVCATNN